MKNGEDRLQAASPAFSPGIPVAPPYGISERQEVYLQHYDNQTDGPLSSASS